MIDIRPATQRTIDLVTSLADEQLGLPTPCPEASVGELIDHLGVFAVRFRAAARKESEAGMPPPSPPSVDNLEAGWRDRISRDLLALADVWSDPQAWDGSTYAGGMEMPAEVAGLVTLDELVVHGWDIAVATTQPYDPTTPEIEATMGFVTSFEAPRDGTLFGPVVALADNASPFERLLGLTGRDPRVATIGGIMTTGPGLRPVVLQMGITLDGFVHGAQGYEDWGLPPEEDDVVEWKAASLREAGTHIMGRVTYEAMASVWPNSTGVYADVMNEIPKVVFSKSLTTAEWAESRIASGDLVDDIDRLKREPGGVILAHGGATFVDALIRDGLIDEYRLVIHPVVIGQGTSLFCALREPLRLDLIETRTFPSGTIISVCRPREGNA